MCATGSPTHDSPKGPGAIAAVDGRTLHREWADTAQGSAVGPDESETRICWKERRTWHQDTRLARNNFDVFGFSTVIRVTAE